LKKVPCAKFLGRLATDSPLEGFVKYLAVRVADQQEVIANLVTVDCEQRLGKPLLHLKDNWARKAPVAHRSSLGFHTRTVGDDRNNTTSTCLCRDLGTWA